MQLVLLGPPGAGKGTQAAHIAVRYRIPHIATGDIFRANVKQDTPLGREAKQYMERGDLVPDDVVVRMVGARLSEADTKSGFLLDGFPRTVTQAEALEDLLANPLDGVVQLVVDTDEILRRITKRRTCTDCGEVYHPEFAPPAEPGVCDKCGGKLVHRPDDAEEVVRRRLEEYQEKTEKLERFYAERDLLYRLDGTGPVEQVTERAFSLLDEVLTGE